MPQVVNSDLFDTSLFAASAHFMMEIQSFDDPVSFSTGNAEHFGNLVSLNKQAFCHIENPPNNLYPRLFPNSIISRLFLTHDLPHKIGILCAESLLLSRFLLYADTKRPWNHF